MTCLLDILRNICHLKKMYFPIHLMFVMLHLKIHALCSESGIMIIRNYFWGNPSISVYKVFFFLFHL